MNPEVDSEQTLYLGTEPVDGIEQLIGFPVLRVHGHFGASGEANGEVAHVLADGGTRCDMAKEGIH